MIKTYQIKWIVQYLFWQSVSFVASLSLFTLYKPDAGSRKTASQDKANHLEALFESIPEIICIQYPA